MKAALLVRTNHIEVHDIPEPRPGPYQCVARVLACGFCNGTDLKIMQGHWPGTDSMPLVLGHEAVAEVIFIGEKVRNLKQGDHVVQGRIESIPELGIGSAWGGFVEYVLVTDWQAMQADGEPIPFPFLMAQQSIPKDLDILDGVMLITLKEVASALQGFHMQTGKPMMIYGDGPVGLCMAMSARVMGASEVILCGHHDERLALAHELGVFLTINSAKQSVVDEIRQRYPKGLPLIVDAVGSASIVQESLAIVAEEGHIGMYGFDDGQKATLDWHAAPPRWSFDYLVVPSLPRFIALHDPIVEWIKEGKIHPRRLVTHQGSIDKVPELAKAVANRSAIKAVMVTDQKGSGT